MHLRNASRTRRYAGLVSACAAVTGVASLGTAVSAYGATPLVAGDLLVATSVYGTGPTIVPGTTQLPPGCTTGCVTAVANGAYPYVFNNAPVDGSFGVTSPIELQEITPSGSPVGTIEVPNSGDSGVTSGSDQMVTSFSSKSELALNLSTSGQSLTFMGYDTGVNAVDVSNSNTPGAVDPTNPVSSKVYRSVAQLNADGSFHFTQTNAYSGNNGRAAILDDANGGNWVYTAGNAGNGSNPEPSGVVTGAGAQLLQLANAPQSAQTPGLPTPAGSFNLTQLGDAADKSAKDNNFRGLALSNGALYYTKGSGGNGADTVYFLDTTGTACPSGGVGVPASGASLPTSSVPAFNNSNSALGLTASNPGLAPTNMCVLKGFPTAIAKTAGDSNLYPFGLWFANPTTLYVADEGAGDTAYSPTTNTYTAAASSTTAGLQKWVFNSATGSWQLAYTLQSGLNLGQPYTVAGYPTGNNTGYKGLPWAPATDGLRNITGKVNSDGTVSIWAETSTVSGSGDVGADPNALVSITDQVAATSLPSAESFQTVVAPANGVVVRGVSFTPGSTTNPNPNLPETPWAPLLPLAAAAGGAAVVWNKRRRSTSAS